MSDTSLGLLLRRDANQMKAVRSKDYIKHCFHFDSPETNEVLDDIKGSYAVEYVLEALLAKGNQHTIYSALELIRKARADNKGRPGEER